MYSIEKIVHIYDEYDEEGYATDDSEVICSTAYITVNADIDDVELSKMVIKEHSVDYVIIKEEGEIDAIHLSHEYCKADIQKNGLESGGGDFGYGLYAIEKYDDIALDNLKTWAVDNFMYSENNILICNIKYSGEYYRCITKGCNEGFLLLDEFSAKVESIDVVPIDDFLLR